MMSYPNTFTLLPTLSAAAVLAARPALTWTSPARALSLPVFQWLGARSYSWYLWHWPAIIFAQNLFPGTPIAPLLSIIVSLVIASVVFAHFEDPIRKGVKWPALPRRSLAGGGLAIATVLVSSAGFSQIANLSGRGMASKELIAALKSAAKDRGKNYTDECHRPYNETSQPECIYGDTSGHHRVVLFGDSHAAQWFAPVDAAAKLAGWKFYAWTKTSCPSTDFTVWYRPRKTPYSACDQWRSEIIARLTGPDRPDLVLLSNMETYSGSILDRRTGSVLTGRDADQAWREGLRSLVDRITRAGVPIVIIRDTPTAYKSFSKCLALGGGAQCDKPRDHAIEHNPEVLRIASEHKGQVETLDLTDRICGEKFCPTVADNKIVYLDYHHLNSTYAATLYDAFLAVLKQHSN